MITSWVIVGLSTAYVAATKNRSFSGWLVLGLLLPIIGFIIVFFLPEGHDKPVLKSEE